MQELINASEVYYNVNPRKYHTYQHSKDVIARIYEIMPDAPPALILAGAWHDAIYWPGADRDHPGINETASACALHNTYKHLPDGVSTHECALARILIAGTTVADHLTHMHNGGLQSVLLDADLGGLAAPWHEFVNHQHNIITENFAVVDNTSIAACSTFLQKLAYSRSMIFHTEEGRAMYEDLARQNINQFASYRI